MTANEHFGSVIIGSGFGGSVMAARLAASKRGTVCLLERGKAYAPGDFPRSPKELSKAFWDPSKQLQGMFNVWSFDKFGALVSSGLGGGSLIYANVMLRKPPESFVEFLPDGKYEDWPIQYEDLETHYKTVEEALGTTVFPFDVPNAALTSKARAMIEAAKHLNAKWEPAPLAVSFGDKQGNPTGDALPNDVHNFHGRTRVTCRMCGECNIGCNYGSKNTLDHNYLSHAKRDGAVIRPRCEVRSFKRLDNNDPKSGYSVDYVVHSDDPDEKSQSLPLHTITCDRLILSAGALGSPYLLLKNAANVGTSMPALGNRFCTNGDLLSIVLKAKEANGGWRKLDPSRGPVITGYITIGKSTRESRGYLVEDAGIPDIVSWLVHAADSATNLERALRFVKRWASGVFGWNRDRDLSAEFSALFGDCELSVSSLPLLGMGRDTPNGKMTLEEGQDDEGRPRKSLQIDWSQKKSGPFFDDMRGTMQSIAKALDGKYVDDPVWALGRVITVHPLGGCPMGINKTRGVVDKTGKVFDAGNLYVADGSVLPGPVGPNPALTIAATADLFADSMA